MTDPSPRKRRAAGRPRDGQDRRAALVAATLQLLEDARDPMEVTVTAIVEVVGCTPPTLYHYWPKRELLLREASALGFAEFRRRQTAAARPETDPLARIRARGRAYLEFALSRPLLFRVLFLDRPAPGALPASVEQPGQGLQDLIDDVSDAMSAGQIARAEPLDVAVGLWAATHGIAALWVATPEIPRELAITVSEAQTDALLAGYSAPRE